MVSVLECLHHATLELVRATPLKQRLVCAYRHLGAVPLDRLPAEVRDAFEHVMATLRFTEPRRGEDAVAASVRKMSTQEAEECSNLIVDIYGIAGRALLQGARHASTARPAPA